MRAKVISWLDIRWSPVLALGVMLIMVMKPGWAVGTLELLLAAGLGLWAGMRAKPTNAADQAGIGAAE
ncbi:MAG: hypothetical protein ACRD2D_02890 [Terriglobales bacterium]